MRAAAPREKSPPEAAFWSSANRVEPAANRSARPESWKILAAMARS